MMPLVELSDDEIWYLMLLVSSDTNDGQSHPNEEILYDKLVNLSS